MALCDALVQTCPFMNGLRLCGEGGVSLEQVPGMTECTGGGLWKQRWCAFGCRCLRWNAVVVSVLSGLDVCLSWIPLYAALEAHSAPHLTPALRSAQNSYLRLLSLMSNIMNRNRAKGRHHSVDIYNGSTQCCTGDAKTVGALVHIISPLRRRHFAVVVDGLVARYVNAGMADTLPCHKVRLRLLVILSSHFLSNGKATYSHQGRGLMCPLPLSAGLRSVMAFAIAGAKSAVPFQSDLQNPTMPVEIGSSSALVILWCLGILGAGHRFVMCSAAIDALTTISEATRSVLPTTARDEARFIYESLMSLASKRCVQGQCHGRHMGQQPPLTQHLGDGNETQTYILATIENQLCYMHDGGGGDQTAALDSFDSLPMSTHIGCAPFRPPATNIARGRHASMVSAVATAFSFTNKALEYDFSSEEAQLTGPSDPIATLVAYTSNVVKREHCAVLSFQLLNQTNLPLRDIVITVGTHGPFMASFGTAAHSMAILLPGKIFDWLAAFRVVVEPSVDDAIMACLGGLYTDCSLWRRSLIISVSYAPKPNVDLCDLNVSFNANLRPSARGNLGDYQTVMRLSTTYVPHSLSSSSSGCVLELAPVMFLRKARRPLMAVSAFADVWRTLLFSRVLQLSCHGTRATVARAVFNSGAASSGCFTYINANSDDANANPIFQGGVARTWAGSYVAVWIVCVARNVNDWVAHVAFRSSDSKVFSGVDVMAWVGALFNGDSGATLLLLFPHSDSGSGNLRSNSFFSFDLQLGATLEYGHDHAIGKQAPTIDLAIAAAGWHAVNEICMPPAPRHVGDDINILLADLLL